MSLKVNKKSVKQAGGSMIPQQPAMQPEQPMHQMPDGTMMPGATHGEQPGMQQQQQIDPAVQQIGEFLQKSLQEGAQAEELVMSLMQQEVDQQTIGQAFMMVGYKQEDVVTLFEQVQIMSEQKAASAREVNQNPQELARNQELQERQQGPVETESIDTETSEMMMAKSGIEIDPKNKGKFTRWAKARGMGVQEAARKVMANKDRYPPSVVKMANFARNAAKFKKEEGGESESFSPRMMYKDKNAVKATDQATYYKLIEDGYVDLKKAVHGGDGDVVYPSGVASSSNALPFKMNMEPGAYSTMEGDINFPIFGTEGDYQGRRIRPQLNGAADGVETETEEVTTDTEVKVEDPKTDMDWIQKLIDKGEKTSPNNLTDFSQFMTNMNTTIGEQPTDGNNSIKKVNNTISQGPLYISPNTYEDNGFSLGNAFNSIMRVGNNAFSSKDLDGDGRKDGYLRDVTGILDSESKLKDQKIQKYLDADYNVNFDGVFTEDNIKNADIAYKKFLFENPTADDQFDAVGNLVNKGLEDNNIPVEIPQDSKEKYKDFINQNTELLGKKAKATYEAIRKKLGFRLGGSLPKAQFSVPETGAPFANPFEGPMQGPMPSDTPTFEEWVLQDPVRRGGANAKQEYKAFVDGDSAVTEETVTEETEIPTVANSNAPTDWDKDGDGIPDMGIDIDMGDGTGVAGDFASAYANITKPTVDADFGGIKGFAERAYNSPITKGFEGISGGIIDLTANIFNPLKNRKKAIEADADKRSRVTADELFAIETDPFNSRGTNNINGGPKGSEADRTTGLYLNQGVQMSKMGGGTNNEGFKKLPQFVQNQILAGMRTGGEAAYLANRDRVIQQAMASKKETGGETVSVDSKMLAKLIAAGADIEML